MVSEDRRDRESGRSRFLQAEAMKKEEATIALAQCTSARGVVGASVTVSLVTDIAARAKEAAVGVGAVGIDAARRRVVEALVDVAAGTELAVASVAGRAWCAVVRHRSSLVARGQRVARVVGARVDFYINDESINDTSKGRSTTGLTYQRKPWC
jgi:hypothetical protein